MKLNCVAQIIGLKTTVKRVNSIIEPTLTKPLAVRRDQNSKKWQINMLQKCDVMGNR